MRALNLSRRNIVMHLAISLGWTYFTVRVFAFSRGWALFVFAMYWAGVVTGSLME
jgi:hypothetical protein